MFVKVRCFFLFVCRISKKVQLELDETRHAGSFSSLSLEGINLLAPPP